MPECTAGAGGKAQVRSDFHGAYAAGKLRLPCFTRDASRFQNLLPNASHTLEVAPPPCPPASAA
jgi:hypothetical protein